MQLPIKAVAISSGKPFRASALRRRGAISDAPDRASGDRPRAAPASPGRVRARGRSTAPDPLRLRDPVEQVPVPFRQCRQLAATVARRYVAMRSSHGNMEVVAPTSAPMFGDGRLARGAEGSRTGADVLHDGIGGAGHRELSGDRGSRPSAPSILPACPSYRRNVRGVEQFPGSPAITSTASAPPTPTAQAPRPPALGCASRSMMSAPGKAQCSTRPGE